MCIRRFAFVWLCLALPSICAYGWLRAGRPWPGRPGARHERSRVIVCG